MRERKRLQYKPRFEGPIEGWVKNFINKNKWRVEDYMEFDDLLQDAYAYFLVCSKRYTNVESPKHFMALFQTCIRNYINDLSKQRTRRLATAERLGADVDAEFGHEDVHIAALLGELPEEVQELAIKLLSDQTPSARGRTTNQHWCNLVGLDAKEVDLQKLVRLSFYFG